ncbi:MAG: archease [Thermodesulfobacteriota bacterium]
MPFEFIDDIATADVAFRAWGRTAEELFVAASDAMLNVMVADLASVQARRKLQLSVTAEDHEMLLFALLQELIFYKDAEMLLLRVPAVSIAADGELLRLTAVAEGEEIDVRRHEMGVDVKAVTLHRYRVEESAQGWQAMVILDI